jgi:hypothetical protein
MRTSTNNATNTTSSSRIKVVIGKVHQYTHLIIAMCRFLSCRTSFFSGITLLEPSLNDSESTTFFASGAFLLGNRLQAIIYSYGGIKKKAKKFKCVCATQPYNVDSKHQVTGEMVPNPKNSRRN